jgi:hypothetical protein
VLKLAKTLIYDRALGVSVKAAESKSAKRPKSDEAAELTVRKRCYTGQKQPPCPPPCVLTETARGRKLRQ